MNCHYHTTMPMQLTGYLLDLNNLGQAIVVCGYSSVVHVVEPHDDRVPNPTLRDRCEL